MKINDYITYINNPEDVVYLRTKLLPVNMRLFKSSAQYRHLIKHICNYIRWLALTEVEDYKKPHGMSGANAAIPFNIIGIVRSRGKKDEYCQIMINPEITYKTPDIEIALSNCGSIRLKQPINVPRNGRINIKYYNEDGNECNEYNLSKEEEGFTIQHEIDHNNGILITDY